MVSVVHTSYLSTAICISYLAYNILQIFPTGWGIMFHKAVTQSSAIIKYFVLSIKIQMCVQNMQSVMRA